MYVEKEKELMDAMRQNGFELFDGNSDDAYDTLERIFMAFVDYANCVIRMQVMVPIWRNRYEGEDLRDKIQEIDCTRRIYHEAAISSLVKLNRLCKMHGLPAYSDTNTSDLYEVADFVGTWISEVYSDGQSRSMDAAVSGKNSEYPLYCMRQHLGE